MAATLDLKSKEEKDAELDKRIEALRRKNEALIRRYQEIEEDRKKAELEGVAVTAPRKGRSGEENVAVDVEKSMGPSRRSPGAPRPPGASRGGRAHPQQGGRSSMGRASRGWEDSAGEHPRGAGGRGRRGRGRGSPRLSGAGDNSASDRKSKEWEERRRQNIEKMNEEMEKIAEYERNQREGVLEPNPVRNFLDDPRRRSGPLEEPERDRREGSRRHGRNWGGSDFERVRCGLEQERQGRRTGLSSAGDMTISMTGRERSEYLRWKQEREKIDQERLQRHRKPTGQWRREWDAEKSDGMFRDGPAPAPEPSHRYDDQAWARPPKPPTFGEFLSQHKAEVSSRRRRKSNRPQAKAAPRTYSGHDEHWETKEAVSPVPEVPPPTPPEEESSLPKPADTLAPVHRPPEDEGEEEEEEEDEEWEDVSEEVTEDEEVEEEEEGGSELEEEPAHDYKPQQAPVKPTLEEVDPVPSRPEEPLSPAPAEPLAPSSPFSPAEDHQPVSDWGEEMELNFPGTACPPGALSVGGDQPASQSLESEPSLPGAPKAEEEGSEASPEADPEGPETAEITDFQRASPNS